MKLRHIYVDYNATTPVAPSVVQALTPYLTEVFGNASSVHRTGQQARAAVEKARAQVAALVGARAREIVFTSGGTEADNLAIRGVVGASRNTHKHVIISQVEHHAVLNTCQALEAEEEAEDVEVTYVKANGEGVVQEDDIRQAITPNTVLISLMHANNELGTIQPVAAVGRIAREHRIPFHTDAVQSVGKIPVAVKELGVDLLSLSAHKIYGPKGVGALYVRGGLPLRPILFGGRHEKGRRPGTENVAGIVGLGAAAERVQQILSEEAARLAALRDSLEKRLLEKVPASAVNGGSSARTPNTTNIYFAGVDGEALVIALDLKGIACSTGAACSAGVVEPSHVLTAIGLSPARARASLRFSLGHATTQEDIDYIVEMLPGVVEHLRALSPAYQKEPAVGS